MDVDECVLSAGRAVLDMVEQEWQPLSPGELEQRLDQAVEETLEAELVANLRAQPSPTVYVQLLQHQANVSPQVPQSPTDGEVIADLLQTSGARARMAGRARLSLSNTVLLSISLLTERVSYRSLSHRFHLEKGNVHRIFFSFCQRVNTLEEKLIKWPAGRLIPRLSDQCWEEQRALPRVLGALGRTLIPIRLPAGKGGVESAACEVKRMKKARPGSWLDLELLCDRDGRLRHCRISNGSDVDGGRTLRDKLGQHPELMPPGCCLVARAGYPLSAHILTPYSGRDGAKEKLFNRTLEEHFRVLDQTVANLRARFQRLRNLDVSSYDRARAVVLTACVLHNVFLDMGQVVEGEVGEEETIGQEEGGEEDDEGVQRREAVSDLLFKYLDSGTA
uniref:Elongin B n=1 Tax=Takifugu rubripes TaxID=31033 RepID=A0A674MXA5_TAKRU